MIRISAMWCPILGHRRDRLKAWHDNVDWRAPCVRCGATMIKSRGRGWRAFESDDFSPQRRGMDDEFKPLPPAPTGSPISATGPVGRSREQVDADVVGRAVAMLSADPSFMAMVGAGIRNPTSRAMISAACQRAAGGRQVAAATVASVTASFYPPVAASQSH